MVGYAFMGAAHSQAWRTAPHVFDLPLRPGMAVLCGRDAAAVHAAAGRLGWAATETDWRALIKRDDVHLVDVCTPGELHAEVAIAALEAGKHVLCEKPLANTEAEAEAMAAAAARAAARGVRSMTGFNYRRVPAVALARQLVADGRIGQVRHVRASYLQDWLVDPSFPLTWRLQRERAGSGALGDLGAHIVDLAQYLTGELIAGVSAATATFVGERPLPETGDGRSRSGPVTVDDAAVFTARLRSGALASFEATRFATGRKNQLRIELNGDARQPGVRPGKAERAGVLRPRRRKRRGGLPPHPGHRARPSLPVRLVAARPRARLGAHLYPPSPRPGDRHRHGHRSGAVIRRRPAGAARPGRRRAQRRARVSLDARAHELKGSLRCPDRSPCSPASGLTCPWRRSAGTSGSGATTASNWPAGAITSTFSAPCTRTATWPAGTQLLAKYDLKCWAISNHLVGQAVCDHPIDARHQGILPARIWGDGEPEGVRQRAAAEMADTARAAAAFGVDTVIGFTGSSIWHTVAMFPPVPAAMIDEGYADFARRWNPILDTFDAEGVRFAHEVHPSEIAYDFWTTSRALEAVEHRPAFGLNFDPSHFVWQDLDPVAFLAEYRDRIYHVDCKEARKRLDGRSGRLGSHLPWGDPRRGWDFVSAGRGDIRWEDIFRMLNSIGYSGPISIEWEDAGMDRLAGAAEAITFLRRFDFDPPQAAFDAAFSSGRD